MFFTMLFYEFCHFPQAAGTGIRRKKGNMTNSIKDEIAKHIGRNLVKNYGFLGRNAQSRAI
ncbi:MAG: hypothetical protein BAA00_11865 [Parageobacillus thermoglucosidasius]|nr:MAG: hypothetical protein BAA00_11865 [Parageobacillus thermoglucosidasius]RDE36203.1 hypothetical protein DV713_01015 [Parageobacillus thermoglucosidasius]